MSEPVRVDVVQMLVDAVLNPTGTVVSKLADLGGATAAEKAAAQSLTVAALAARQDHRERVIEARRLLLRRHRGGRPSWPDLFDQLSAQDVRQLRDLYAAMDDGAREEFDRRYGRPQL